MSPRFRAPSLLKTALEGRVVGEYLSLLAASPLLNGAPKGDGHTVLVIPGFMAADSSTAPMRRFLARLGYDAHGWGLGRNRGPHPDVIRALYDQYAALAADAPISLIGWSLGGMFARAMARRNPERVRQVITLVSPFRMNNGDRSRASAMYNAMYVQHVDAPVNMNRHEPLTVPATSIYTRADGIVDWRACLDEPGPERENIEVLGASHIGIGMNPAALYIVADRLAQPPGEWRPFEVPRPLRAVVRTGAQPEPAPA